MSVERIPPPASALVGKVTLIPNQQVAYDIATGSFQKFDTVNTGDFIAWKDNILKFDGVRLEEAVKTLSRWYGVAVRLQNPGMFNCEIVGEYEDTSLNAVLENWIFVLDIRYERTADGVIIRGKGGC